MTSGGAVPGSSTLPGAFADSELQSVLERECRDLGVAFAQAKLMLRSDAPALAQQAYKAYRGERKKEDDYHVRKWLGIRLNAVKRGMVVDPSVTPDFLRYITSDTCPVTLEPLDFGTKGQSRMNPSLDRLVNEVGYVAGNICVLSQRANRAKGEMTFDEVVALAQQGVAIHGLEGVEWMRLCSLMYGAWNKAFGQGDPSLMPLAAIPAPGIFMSTPQVVQLLLTRLAQKQDIETDAHLVWLDLTKQAGVPVSRYNEFMQALMQALALEDYAGNAWLHPGVFDAFERWYNPSHKPVLAYVEAVLKFRTERLDDPVATMLWPLRGDRLH